MPNGEELEGPEEEAPEEEEEKAPPDLAGYGRRAWDIGKKFRKKPSAGAGGRAAKGAGKAAGKAAAAGAGKAAGTAEELPPERQWAAPWGQWLGQLYQPLPLSWLKNLAQKQ